jgi:ribosomal protein S18 acetylase RimI-like enzyme
MSIADVEFRCARLSDVDAIAEAHRDSIASLGPSFYAARDVEAWKANVTGALYLEAMRDGEVFFLALQRFDLAPLVLGFSSAYRIDDSTYGTSVYVRGRAARQGIGRALLATAENHATARGATCIQIDASLAGVEFYRSNGYREVRRGETRLAPGLSIATVAMRKNLIQSVGA